MIHRKLTVFHYPACSTCRTALKMLKQHGYEMDLHDLWEEAPTVEQLKKWIPLSGLPIQKWFNVSGDAYRELGMKDKLPGMPDEQKMAVLAGNGRLMKRPVVTDGVSVTVGFKEEEYRRVWK